MDDFAEITDLDQLEAAIAEQTEIITPLVERGRSGETLTPEERATLAEAGDRRDAAQARVQQLADEAAADAAAQDELLNRFDAPDTEPAAETPAEETPVAEAPAAEAVTPEPVAEEAPVSDAIAAAGGRPAPARRPVPQPEVTDLNVQPSSTAEVAIVASASLAQIGIGATVDLDQVGEMLGAQARSFPKPTGNGKSRELRYHPIAQFQITHDDAHTLTGDVDSDNAKIEAALNPANVRGVGRNGEMAQGLTAAGGWCAPSEVLYGIPVVGESLAGIASFPEMDASRGGVKSTLGPNYSTLYAAIGFEQTEAQAIAGDTKDCYEIDCPTFTETRMDVKGVCLMVPILTEAGYPEYVSRITSGALVVHAHKMNAYKLAKIEAGSTPVNAAGQALGTTMGDTLFVLETRAEFTRQKFVMEFDETLEVILPHWLRPYLRRDLALRMGADPESPIMDSVLDAHFTASHLAVQWVYDWQTYADPTSSAPTTFKALIYPAGTWLVLTKSVISLSAVYDAASLATNTYTGTFTEEGVGVRKMTNAPSEVVTLPICSSGRVGAANFTCS